MTDLVSDFYFEIFEKMLFFIASSYFIHYLKDFPNKPQKENAYTFSETFVTDFVKK